MGVPADHHWSVYVPLPIARQKKKKNYFVCLSVCCGTLSCYGVDTFFLPIPHGMHLVVPVQLCPFGWYVIPTGHFPQKSPSRNLKIGFPLSPSPKPSFLWPVTSPYPVLAGYRLVRSGPCACLSSMYVQNLLTAHASAVIGLHSLPPVFDYFLVSISFMACPIRGCALLDGGLYFFFSTHSFSCYHLLPYHSIIPVAKLFCLNLVGPLWACCLFFS